MIAWLFRSPAARRAWATLFVVALGVACASLQWEPRGPRRTESVAGAELVGADECGVCHEDVQGHERIAAYHGGCESCHGGGSLHADSEEVADIRFPANEDCLTCHAPGRDTHLSWGTGEHSRAGLLCSDCHNPHSTTRYHLRLVRSPNAGDMDAASGVCVGCHRDVEAQLAYPSRHPIRDGGIGCMSCHDPHEDRRVTGGDPNRVCGQCHQDFEGPWIFEHPPVVEGCITCHNPHGAVSDHLLEISEPAICLSCHTLNDAWHHDPQGSGILDNTTITENRPTAPTERVIRQSAQLFLKRCSDCHGAVHGSYTDEHLRH